jgi:hypothetical protein
MGPGDFMRLPPAVRLAVVVLLWPAIWATVGMAVAFAGDVIRQTKKRTPEMVRSNNAAIRS